MMRFALYFIFSLLISACSQAPTNYWEPYDEQAELIENQAHENPRMRYKLIQSKFLDKDALWAPFEKELNKFGLEKYETLKPLILEQDIPTIQAHIAAAKLSYEELTTFYLYRIRSLESDKSTTLNTILALNPDVIEQARQKDKNKKAALHPIYGMPILLKDNINTADMPTTAGAAILAHHQPDEDAFIVSRLKAKGALILGKVNLSEWAYFFCEGCPLGYSAIGGQTLNPYGRRIFESGGSSSGSGVAVAANYAVAAIGSETSGSILSPSIKNSVVGFKPTIGLVSRTGIVPISSTLDTAGPMTKNVADNAIVLDAIAATDPKDNITTTAPRVMVFLEQEVAPSSLEGVRLGAMTNLMEADSLYRNAVQDLVEAGAEVITYTPERVPLDGFISILNGDMRNDLPAYFQQSSTEEFKTLDVQAVVDFNKQDSTLYMPYEQARLDGVISDTISSSGLAQTKDKLNKTASSFFSIPMNTHNLDAILSMNYDHAAHAAISFYPCLTVPMGYSTDGEPAGLTFLAPSFSEEKLLALGAAYESVTKHRKPPTGYQ